MRRRRAIADPPARARPRSRGERGFALLIVLWTLSLLALLISQVTGSGRQALRLAGNLREQAVLQAIAEGAVQEAGFHVAAAGAAHWPADGAVRAWREGGAAIRLRITSDAGRVNPSVASVELLAALIAECGPDLPHAAAIAAAIAAWRFPTAQGAYGIDAYRAAGLPYGPPGQPFESLDELGLVIGMTKPLLACLAPHLSLYRDGDPDPNAVDPVVRDAIATATGTPPQPTGSPPDDSIVVVDVVATGPEGARVARRATLRLDPNQQRNQDAVRQARPPFQILAWSG